MRWLVPRAKTQTQADARAELAERGFLNAPSEFLDGATLGALDEVKLFVQAGMSVGTVSFGGWTALHLASANGHLEVVRFLVEQEASIVGETENGNTALDLAVRAGHTDVARYLESVGG